MTTLSKHGKSVQNMTTEQLRKVVLSGSLLAAAASYELRRREEQK